MQELQEVTRPHLMSGSKKQPRFPRKIRLLLGYRPLWIRRRDEIHGWQTLVVGTRNNDVSEIPPLIRRGFGHLSFFSPRNRDNFAVGNECLQLFQLLASRLDRRPLRLISFFFRN